MNQTRTALLQEAELLIRKRGYAAFSYSDLSAKIGIAKASIHHHFPTKEALGVALIDEYLERFEADLEALSHGPGEATAKLLAYGDFFAQGIKEGLLPLCGVLASDVSALPESIKSRVEKFFQQHLDWLEKEIRAGVKRGELRLDLKPKRAARVVLSTLQGASLTAWALGESASVKPTLKDLLAQLGK